MKQKGLSLSKVKAIKPLATEVKSRLDYLFISDSQKIKLQDVTPYISTRNYNKFALIKISIDN